MIRGREGRLVLGIALVALAVRVFLLLVLEGHVVEDDWSFGYESGRIAESLVTERAYGSPFGESSGPTAWLMPGYPGLLALTFVLFGTYSKASAVAILLINCLLSTATCVAVYLLAGKIFGSSTGLLAAALFALYPPSVWHAINTIWDTTLLALLVVLLVYGLYHLRGGFGLGVVAAYGSAVGLALWVNPVALLLVPLTWLRIFLRSPRSRPWKVAAALLLTVATAVVVSPWLARNQQVFGRLFLRSNLGLELKLGNSPEAWEHYRRSDRSSLFLLGHPSVVPEEFERYVSLGEVAYVDAAREDALELIAGNPLEFLRMSLWRFSVFWLSDLGVDNEWAGNLSIAMSLSWLRTLCHLLPLPFMIVGLVVSLRRKLDVGPLVGILLLFPVVYYFTHVSERYRFPVEPFILVLAAFGLLWSAEALLARLRPECHA